MIRKSLFIGALAMMAAAVVSCDNDNQGKLLEPKLYFENSVINVEAEGETYPVELVSRLSTAVGHDVNVTYSLGGQDLVKKYNDKYGVTAQLFPAENCQFVSNTSSIAAGDIFAAACELDLVNLSTCEEGATYVLPILINTNSVDLIPDANVAYLVIKKPVRIYKATEFSGKWLDVRLPSSFKTTSSMTIEGLVYATSWKMLGTIFGNEGILIVRTGDLGHPTNELQVAGNIAMQMPDPNVWQTNKWYHVAFTYDAGSGAARIYLNGELIADKNAGSGKTFDFASRFCVGYAYDYDSSRKWYGYMSEVRLWSVARTQNQIKENMMLVDPASTGLEGYWKLNGTDIEQRDGTWYILDQTSHHYDATSNNGMRGENGGRVSYVQPTVVDVDVRL